MEVDEKGRGEGRGQKEGVGWKKRKRENVFLLFEKKVMETAASVCVNQKETADSDVKTETRL